MDPDKTSHQCLMLTGYLSNPQDSLQEIPLPSAGFHGLPRVLILKDKNGKYDAGYAIATSLEVI